MSIYQITPFLAGISDPQPTVYFEYGNHFLEDELKKQVQIESARLGLGHLQGWTWHMNELNQPNIRPAFMYPEGMSQGPTISPAMLTNPQPPTTQGTYGLICKLTPKIKAILDKLHDQRHGNMKAMALNIEVIISSEQGKRSVVKKALIYWDPFNTKDLCKDTVDFKNHKADGYLDKEDRKKWERGLRWMRKMGVHERWLQLVMGRLRGEVTQPEPLFWTETGIATDPLWIAEEERTRRNIQRRHDQLGPLTRVRIPKASSKDSTVTTHEGHVSDKIPITNASCKGLGVTIHEAEATDKIPITQASSKDSDITTHKAHKSDQIPITQTSPKDSDTPTHEAQASDKIPIVQGPVKDSAKPTRMRPTPRIQGRIAGFQTKVAQYQAAIEAGLRQADHEQLAHVAPIPNAHQNVVAQNQAGPSQPKHSPPFTPAPIAHPTPALHKNVVAENQAGIHQPSPFAHSMPVPNLHPTPVSHQNIAQNQAGLHQPKYSPYSTPVPIAHQSPVAYQNDAQNQPGYVQPNQLGHFTPVPTAYQSPVAYQNMVAQNQAAHFQPNHLAHLTPEKAERAREMRYMYDRGMLIPGMDQQQARYKAWYEDEYARNVMIMPGEAAENLRAHRMNSWRGLVVTKYRAHMMRQAPQQPAQQQMSPEQRQLLALQQQIAALQQRVASQNKRKAEDEREDEAKRFKA